MYLEYSLWVRALQKFTSSFWRKIRKCEVRLALGGPDRSILHINNEVNNDLELININSASLDTGLYSGFVLWSYGKMIHSISHFLIKNIKEKCQLILHTSSNQFFKYHCFLLSLLFYSTLWLMLSFKFHFIRASLMRQWLLKILLSFNISTFN